MAKAHHGSTAADKVASPEVAARRRAIAGMARAFRRVDIRRKAATRTVAQDTRMARTKAKHSQVIVGDAAKMVTELISAECRSDT